MCTHTFTRSIGFGCWQWVGLAGLGYLQKKHRRFFPETTVPAPQTTIFTSATTAPGTVILELTPTDEMGIFHCTGRFLPLWPGAGWLAKYNTRQTAGLITLLRGISGNVTASVCL